MDLLDRIEKRVRQMLARNQERVDAAPYHYGAVISFTSRTYDDTDYGVKLDDRYTGIDDEWWQSNRLQDEW